MFSHNSISVDEPGSVSISNSSSNSRRILTTISNGPHNHLQPLGKQSVSFEPSANSGPTNADTLGAFHPNGTTSHNQRFPTTATRQRSSNVNTIDAELEFHKTALNTCRSNIAQQEVELKRLKESIEIRNKRIMNLEAQVGHASDLFANRNINENSADGLNSNLCRKIDQLLEKLSNPSNAPTNIVINSCQAHRNAPTKISASTQTDQQTNLPNFICRECGKSFQTNQ